MTPLILGSRPYGRSTPCWLREKKPPKWVQGSGTSIRTDFDSPDLNTNTFGSATPLALEGTTGGGDSGGPLLVDFGSGYRVVGSLNVGYNPYGDYSEYGDVSIWAPGNDPDNIIFLQGMGIAVPEPSAAAMLAVVLVIATHRRKRPV
jgi:hypothetical protein